MKDYPKSLILIGGYHCALTDDESNAWSVHIFDHPDYASHSRNTAALEVAVRTGSTTEAQSLADERRVLEARLFMVGKAWFESVVKPQRDKETT